jgi:molybdopterin converting factor small subunit
MITFQISGYLTEFTGGRVEITVEDTAANVGEALSRLWNRYVGLRDRVLTERGDVRPHVNVFVNGQVVRRLDETLPDNDDLLLGRHAADRSQGAD